jgi:hypothetical protein
MPSIVLKDFWFPVLLFLASVPFVFVGMTANGHQRRVWWTVSAVFVLVAVLSFIWGDPVRGPFAYLTSSKNPEEFTFHAGFTCSFPVKRLKDGIDFTDCVRMGVGSQPIQLWIKRTWWSGLQVRMSLMGQGEHRLFLYDDNKVSYIDPGFDLNHDEYALEFVSPTYAPMLQLIVEEDYSEIYINATIASKDQMVLLKDKRLRLLSFQDAAKPENKLERIFKYPSYAHHGER